MPMRLHVHNAKKTKISRLGQPPGHANGNCTPGPSPRLENVPTTITFLSQEPKGYNMRRKPLVSQGGASSSFIPRPFPRRYATEKPMSRMMFRNLRLPFWGDGKRTFWQKYFGGHRSSESAPHHVQIAQAVTPKWLRVFTVHHSEVSDKDLSSEGWAFMLETYLRTRSRTSCHGNESWLVKNTGLRPSTSS